MASFIIDNPNGTGKLKVTIEPYYEETKSNKLYFFGWPSHLGGADTRLAHTIRLWSEFMDITVVPNGNINAGEWTKFLDSLRVKYKTLSDVFLPAKLEGIGMSMCNDFFFSRKIAHTAKEKGLRVIWSSEMMWHHSGELDAITNGIVDTVLYTSDFQKSVLKPNYDKCGFPLKEYVIPNYIDPNDFPLFERSDSKDGLTIGRISRADLDKYPENFPLFYEHLQLTNPKFMVMAWSNALKEKYSWHNFDSKWKLFAPNEITVQKFLSQIDMFVYPLGHKFRESWGRSTVEAMLTGCPVVVPYGHHFVHLIRHGHSGFMYKTYEECRDICRSLERNPDLRKQIGLTGSKEITKLLDPMTHIKMWKEVFNA